jgi:hypothetical protein
MTISLPTDRPFESFGKIGRLKGNTLSCVITEKLDGTNAQIVIEDGKIVAVGSRSRWIMPGKETDNYGFARWVQDNEEELLKLGEGRHFGEWYGSGIQRGYGLTGGDKRFALFNTGRWSNPESRPSCTECVPVLYAGPFSVEVVEETMAKLKSEGSRHVRGFDRPEGVIVYIPQADILLKDTFEHRGGKWMAANTNSATQLIA